MLDGRRDLVRIRERIPSGELEVKRDLGAAADLENHHVVHLAHPRLSQRGRVGALADRIGLERLHVHDHVRPGERTLHRLLDRIRCRVPLLDRDPCGTPMTTSAK